MSAAPADWEEASEEVLASITADVEKFLTVAHDNIYERLLYSVQDYLADNAEYNIASRLAAAEREARAARTRANNAEAENARLLSALRRLERDGILSTAESNASGNPSWERVSGAVSEARAALSLNEAVGG